MPRWEELNTVEAANDDEAVAIAREWMESNGNSSFSHYRIIAKIPMVSFVCVKSENGNKLVLKSEEEAFSEDRCH